MRSNKKDYITRIKANVSIYSTKKTSNILDGSYTSVFMGRSMNFEDLREYIPGDNIKDIDWKASSRSGGILVKRFVAEKKHNIMLVMDSGIKMLGDTPKGKTKKEIALYTAGTIAYLAYKNGDTIGALYSNDGKLEHHPCRTGLVNVEKILAYYDAASTNGRNSNLNDTLSFIVNHMKNKMIIFVITDKRGMNSVSDETIKRLLCRHDLLYVNIGDIGMTDDDLVSEDDAKTSFLSRLFKRDNVDRSTKTYDLDMDRYIPEFIAENKQLWKLEQEKKREIIEENKRKTVKHGIMNVDIDDESEIVVKIIELLEKHKHANIR